MAPWFKALSGSEPESRRLRTFLQVWAGQTASLLGSGLTSFALGVWVFQQTGSATSFTLISVMASLPGMLFFPIAGALVDRWNRRLAILLSDSASAVITIAILALVLSDQLAIWHIYLYAGANSLFKALQFPAFSAAVTQLVPKKHLGRASGMISIGQATSSTLAPVLAAGLMSFSSLSAVILADLVTFTIALINLLLVRIPKPKATEAGKASRGTLTQEIKAGWTYIRKRPGLLGLLAFFAGFNFLVPAAFVLTTPLVLSFGDAKDLGATLSTASLGVLAGGFLMTAWGGPKRKIYGILGAAPLPILGLLLTGLRPSLLLIGIGMFLVIGVTPILMGCSQAIWQRKVEQDLQGRVFAIRAVVGRITTPFAYLLAGPLADHVFEPLLRSDGALAGSLGPIFGVGPGRGIGLLFVVFALCFATLTIVASRYRPLRDVELDLPDADADAESASA